MKTFFFVFFEMCNINAQYQLFLVLYKIVSKTWRINFFCCPECAGFFNPLLWFSINYNSLKLKFAWLQSWSFYSRASRACLCTLFLYHLSTKEERSTENGCLSYVLCTYIIHFQFNRCRMYLILQQKFHWETWLKRTLL